MIVQEFYLRNVKWRVKVFYSVTCYYIYEILAALREIGCSGDTLRKAYEQLYDCDIDTGLTFSNKETRESVIVIATTSSAAEFANSLQHEQNHLKRHIVEALGIDPFSEEDSYLSGDIAMAMFPCSKELLCDCCRSKNSKIPKETLKRRIYSV